MFKLKQRASSLIRNALQPKNNTAHSPLAFSFGDPEPVLSRNWVDYLECSFNGRWYETPISMEGLSQSLRSMPHLGSGIIFKRNFLASFFIPHPQLNTKDFEQLALDFIWSGNLYAEQIKSRLGNTIAYKPTLAKYIRIGEDLNTYYQIQHNHIQSYQEHQFQPDRICHIRETDINQEIYGVPEYLSALQSAWLNESATLFRRKYYNNGSHAGYILYMNDAAHDIEDVNKVREALRQSKGPGNFRNLFLYSPNGKKDGVQIIPISEVAAKDDFNSIKEISRDDVLAALRIPPQLLGIVPSNTGGFGNIKDATEMFWFNEIRPIQTRMTAFNQWAGEEIIKFKDFELPVPLN